MWVAYIGTGMIALVLVFMFLRLAIMLSLLWLSPLATIMNRIPGVRLLLPKSVREAADAPRAS